MFKLIHLTASTSEEIEYVTAMAASSLLIKADGTEVATHNDWDVTVSGIPQVVMILEKLNVFSMGKAMRHLGFDYLSKEFWDIVDHLEGTKMTSSTSDCKMFSGFNYRGLALMYCILSDFIKTYDVAGDGTINNLLVEFVQLCHDIDLDEVDLDEVSDRQREAGERMLDELIVNAIRK